MLREVIALKAQDSLKDSAVVSLRGSKSYSNRALMMAALGTRPVSLENLSDSDDSKAMVECLEKFGVAFEIDGSTTRVLPPVQGLQPYKGTFDVGPAGTTMRFLTALCAFIEGAEIELRGSKRMHERPIHVLVDALRSLGADIEYLETEGCPPLRVRGTRVKGTEVSLDGSVSSQYFSAIMLQAPVFSEGLLVKVVGEQVSKSYIDMTLQAVQDFGVSIENHDYNSYLIPASTEFSKERYLVEGDASAASYFWGLAAITGKAISVRNIHRESLQGDVGFAQIMAEMGAQVSYQENAITVRGPADRRLTAVDVDMEQMPDTAQTLAVVAAFAEGVTSIRGLQTLRVKETDRIHALETELGKAGIKTTATEDTISIYGGTPSALSVATYHDHRMAMSFALLGARVEGVEIEDPMVVTKSFPDFWEVLHDMGVATQ